MQTQSATPPGNSSDLAAYDPQLALRVKDVVKMLRDRKAKNGARRLEEVSQHFQFFTVEGAAQYIRKDEIIDELESQPHKLLSVLRFARNVLSVGPIVITWLALFFAANAYQSDLATTRDDVYQPFLLLWQEGFHGRILPFSDAALWDFILLSGLVVLIVGIPYLEWLYRNRLHSLLTDFDATVNDVLAALGKAGANAHLADSDINKITTAIQSTLGRLMLNYDRVAEEARKFVEDTHESTKLLVKNFDDNLIVFNGDVRLLTNDLQKMSQNLSNHDQKLQELTEASSKLAGSSQDLALNAKTMADSATLNTQASQGIDDRLRDLNTAQQEIIKAQKDVVQELSTAQQKVVNDVTTSQQMVVQKIADSQKEVVEKLTDAADMVGLSGKNTRDAASNLGEVAANLEQLTRADFQRMTDGVKQANRDLVAEVRKTSGEAQQVVAGLAQVNAQLLQTTQALNDAARRLAMVTPVQQQNRHRFLFWTW